MSEERRRGVVRRIPCKDTGERRGFFFIKADGAKTDDGVFAHASGIQRTSPTQFAELREGDRVEFLQIAGEKGPRAIEVMVL